MSSTGSWAGNKQMAGGGVWGYAVVHARVRAMYAAMITSQIWARLCEAQGFAALIGALKETVYGPYLSQVAFPRIVFTYE